MCTPQKMWLLTDLRKSPLQKCLNSKIVNYLPLSELLICSHMFGRPGSLCLTLHLALIPCTDHLTQQHSTRTQRSAPHNVEPYIWLWEMYRSSRVLHTSILGKIKNYFKKVKKKSNFFEIKDEYRYCTYKNISLGNYFYFILGIKKKLKMPHDKVLFPLYSS
jgi:hypothetical protein